MLTWPDDFSPELLGHAPQSYPNGNRDHMRTNCCWAPTRFRRPRFALS
jgi:hypothetical protein